VKYVTLCIDIGATSVKAATVAETQTLISEIRSLKTQAPLPPERLVERIVSLSRQFDGFDRVGVGFPGGVLDGQVSDPSNLARAKTGEEDPSIRGAWQRAPLRALLVDALGVPVELANDADVAALGCSEGVGLEVTVTLGTGIGCGRVQDGRLLDHQEIHDVVAKPETRYDSLLGTKAMLAMGEDYWSRDVAALVVEIIEIHQPDKIHLVGGNAPRINRRTLEPFLDRVWVHREPMGILGGVGLFA
jgi:polyphosphate glucokinase